MRLIKDILKEKSGKEVKYSQGRIYLFVAFVSYIIMLSFLAYQTIKCNSTINIEASETIIYALQWIIGLLAGYVFGGKGIEVLKVVMNSRRRIKETPEEKKEEKNLLQEGDGPNI